MVTVHEIVKQCIADLGLSLMLLRRPDLAAMYPGTPKDPTRIMFDALQRIDHLCDPCPNDEPLERRIESKSLELVEKVKTGALHEGLKKFAERVEALDDMRVLGMVAALTDTSPYGEVRILLDAVSSRLAARIKEETEIVDVCTGDLGKD